MVLIKYMLFYIIAQKVKEKSEEQTTGPKM